MNTACTRSLLNAFIVPCGDTPCKSVAMRMMTLCSHPTLLHGKTVSGGMRRPHDSLPMQNQGPSGLMGAHRHAKSSLHGAR